MMELKWWLFLKKGFNKICSDIIALFKEVPNFVTSKMLVLVVSGAFILPILVGFYAFYLCKQETLLQLKLNFLEKKVKALVLKEQLKENFNKTHMLCSPTFLEDEIETIDLLEDEKLLLTQVTNQINYETALNRLQFLTSGKNKIRFIKQSENENKDYQESVWVLENRVEVSKRDINKIISLLEGVNISNYSTKSKRPQLIIKKCILIPRKEFQNNVFYLDLEILQRRVCEKN